MICVSRWWISVLSLKDCFSIQFLLVSGVFMNSLFEAVILVGWLLEALTLSFTARTPFSAFVLVLVQEEEDGVDLAGPVGWPQARWPSIPSPHVPRGRGPKAHLITR